MSPTGTAALALAALLVFPPQFPAALAAQGKASLEAEAGLGYDSNAFQAPGESYFDPFSDTVVEPRRRAGFFVPAGVEGDIRSDGERLDLFADAEAEIKYFLDRELENADTSLLELGAGAELLLREEGRRRDTLRLRPSLRWWRQTYYDRDTGQRNVTRDDEDLGEKSDYDRFGLEARLRERTLPVRVELTAEIAWYEYTEVPARDSLDALLSSLEAEAEFDVGERVTVALTGEYTVRDYDDRRSRDLEGNLVTGSDRLYRYLGAGADLSVDIGPGWTAGLAYERRSREDDFAGYGDYVLDSFSARLAGRDGSGRRLRLEVEHWNRDYPRAFAFDDPGFADLSYSAWEASVRGEIPLRGPFSLRAEYEYVRQRSTDPRYDYGRHIVFLTAVAEF